MATKFKNISSVKSSDDLPSKQRRRKSQLDQLEKESIQGIGIPFVREDDGSVTVDLSILDKVNNDEPIDYESSDFYDNLVDQLDQDERSRLGMLVKANFDLHKQSRSEWENMITQGTTLLGIKLEEKNTPFRGACSAQHPLLMESSVKFQSKASNELLPANGPVKAKVLGEITPEKEAQGNRVANHLNYQLTEEMTEFYSDTERLLLYLPLFGCAFKKVYYSSYLGRPVSEFVPGDQLVVPSNATDLQRADCYTHILYKTQNQLNEDIASGFYSNPKEGLVKPSGIQITEIQTALNSAQGVDVSFSQGDYNTTYTLYEQHIDLCIYKGDKALDPWKDKEEECLASPYIITVNSSTGDVLGIRRNWKEGDPKRIKRVPFVQYQFVPGFTFYGLGFLHLLGNLQLTLTASIRSLVDAGQFATLQGGFKLKGVRIVDDGEPIYPGQFKDIDSSILDINKSIMQLPFKEPSQTLFAMLQYLTNAGQKFADATEQVIGDATNYGPVGTTMALLDASTKFFSAIHKRLHNSQKQELRIIASINGETLPEDLPYNKQAGNMAVSRQDYNETIDVVPVSDPNISSNAHRMAKAQTIMQIAMQAPELHDMREVLKIFYAAVDFGNIDKILPNPEEAQPMDPLTDIQIAVQGKPIKAFPGQDHKSHIAIKQAFLNDPMSGKNPIMQKAAYAITSNIQEHMLLMFMEQVKSQAQLNGQQEGVDPMVAAAQQVAQMNQQKLQQELESAQQNSRDQAALLLAQAELMDSQTQQRKQQFDEVFKVAQLDLDKEELDMKKFDTAVKAEQFNQKLKNDMDKIVQTKGIDAMIDSLKQGHEARMKDKEMKHQKEMKPSPSPTKNK
jgi:tellurite resistance protein